MDIRFAEQYHVLSEISSALEKIGVNYFLTGSVASSLWGEMRMTNDIDVVVELRQEQIPNFVDLLEKDFFVAEHSVVQAVSTQTSVNIIHKLTCLKVDIFVKHDELAKEQYSRAVEMSLPAVTAKIKVASSEDIIISKLIWFKKGNQESERQWTDILGVFKINKVRLDLEYLKLKAHKLGLMDLLEKLLN